MFNWLIIALLLGIVNGNFTMYLYPAFKTNVTVPIGCKLSDGVISCYCDCTVKELCGWTFNSKRDGILEVTFNKPRFSSEDIIIYGYLINYGLNNFKINYHDCNSNTCYPLISYLTDPDFSTSTMLLVCIN